MSDLLGHEVYALRYARATALRSEVFHCHHMHDDADGPQGIDYYFWLVRGEHGVVLVDCGFDAEGGAARRRHHETEPLELLARMGVRPEDVDHLVISHLHYDHVGNVARFPNATVTVARAEYAYWTAPDARRWRLNMLLVDQEDVDVLGDLETDGRLNLVDGPTEIVPGVTVTPVGGHTPGQLITQVSVGGRSIVLASDAAHFAEEWVGDLPFALFHDLDDLWAAYELLRHLEGTPDITVIPGHDPLTARMFESVREECFDLREPRAS